MQHAFGCHSFLLAPPKRNVILILSSRNRIALRECDFRNQAKLVVPKRIRSFFWVTNVARRAESHENRPHTKSWAGMRSVDGAWRKSIPVTKRTVPNPSSAVPLPPPERGAWLTQVTLKKGSPGPPKRWWIICIFFFMAVFAFYDLNRFFADLRLSNFSPVARHRTESTSTYLVVNLKHSIKLWSSLIGERLTKLLLNEGGRLAKRVESESFCLLY